MIFCDSPLAVLWINARWPRRPKQRYLKCVVKNCHQATATIGPRTFVRWYCRPHGTIEWSDQRRNHSCVDSLLLPLEFHSTPQTRSTDKQNELSAKFDHFLRSQSRVQSTLNRPTLPERGAASRDNDPRTYSTVGNTISSYPSWLECPKWRIWHKRQRWSSFVRIVHDALLTVDFDGVSSVQSFPTCNGMIDQVFLV